MQTTRLAMILMVNIIAMVTCLQGGVHGSNVVPPGRMMANPPVPCCGPAQVEFMVVELIALQEMNISLGGMASLDFTKNLLALNETVGGTPPGTTRMVIDYTNAVTYVINDNLKLCSKEPAGVAMIVNQCLPPDALYMGQHRMGLGASLVLDTWKVHYHNKTTDMLVVGFVTPGSCVPVMQYVSGQQNGVNFEATLSMFDYTNGIRDYSVFDIPDYCHQRAPPSSRTPQMTRLQKLIHQIYSRRL